MKRKVVAPRRYVGMSFSEQALKLLYRRIKNPHPYRWGTLAGLEDMEEIEYIEELAMEGWMTGLLVLKGNPLLN